jgi:hypothetical protein
MSPINIFLLSILFFNFKKTLVPSPFLVAFFATKGRAKGASETFLKEISQKGTVLVTGKGRKHYRFTRRIIMKFITMSNSQLSFQKIKISE